MKTTQKEVNIHGDLDNLVYKQSIALWRKYQTRELSGADFQRCLQELKEGNERR